MRTVLCFFTVLSLLSSCLADLRPKASNALPSRESASVLLLKAAKHHGYKDWVKTKKYSCNITDEFYGPIGRIANPQRGYLANFRGIYESGTKNGILQFTDKENVDNRWIVSDGEATIQPSNDKLSRKEEVKIKFWVPTYQYFIEFPHRIIEADALEFIGKENFNGVNCRKVLASWNTVEPQKDIDQYVVWIGADDSIVRIDYTVRDQYKFLKGTAIYERYAKFQGYDVPTEVSVLSSLTGNKKLHKMTFDSFELIR